MHKIVKRVAIAVGALAVVGGFVASPAGAAVRATVTYPLARNSVAEPQVVNNSLTGVDIQTNSLGWTDLDANTQKQIRRGDVTNLEADGPYPGATDLGDLTDQGDNSDQKVLNDSEPHTVWVQCAPGKVALGGGFRLAADASVATMKTIQVVASEPTQIKNGAIVVVPIEGDEAQSIEPNGWAVTAINEGTEPVIVRPWVTCATVAK
ncbi:hypothetical protein [Kribbella sp. CA-247076]|uniref:hypothetical protein n=1 Tax=Kribbella sp. CA-247076 TaxID=3239941 RepID=UPI003D8AE652